MSSFKKVLCNFVLFIKTHQTIYKNYIVWKAWFHRGFEFHRNIHLIKKSSDKHAWEQPQNKIVQKT